MLPIVGDEVILVNRTERPLSFKADGRDHVLKPGENYGFNAGHAEFAYKQHPLPGTQNYDSLQFVSLIGIIRASDGTVLYDCSPIGSDIIAAAAGKELFDIETMPADAQKGRTVSKGRHLAGRETASLATANAIAAGD
jgi:hypothetical protein